MILQLLAKEKVFAFPEPTLGPLNWIIEFGDFIIPCRPSSSDVNVTLLKNDKKVCNCTTDMKFVWTN